MTRTAPVARTLVAFALVGAGLVNLGLVRGAFPRPPGMFWLVVGAAELVVAVLVLRGATARGADPAVLGRLAVGALAVASVLGIALGVAQGTHVGAAAAAAALQLTAAGVVGATTRPDGFRRTRGAAAAGRRRPAVSVAILFVGAVGVSAVASAGLTDTEAGARAVPHGEHRLPDLPGLEGHHHGP
jgi:FtsH-binding integral membrane protein